MRSGIRSTTRAFQSWVVTLLIMAPLSASAMTPGLDYKLFEPLQNVQCMNSKIMGDTTTKDRFDGSIFAGASIAEQSDPAPMSDDRGYALYVLYDPALHIAAVKVTDSPKASAVDAYYILQRVISAPAHISRTMDLSRVSMRSGIHVGSSVAEVTRVYGHLSHYNACLNILTYVFTRYPHREGEAGVGEPKSGVELTFAGPRGKVTRILLFPDSSEPEPKSAAAQPAAKTSETPVPSTTAILLACSFGSGGCGAAGDFNDLTRPQDLQLARAYTHCLHFGSARDQRALRITCARESHISILRSEYKGPLVFIDSGKPGHVTQLKP